MHISPDRGRLAAWIALPLAVVASGAVIAGASYASFTATTDNPSNTFSTGRVDLADDDAGSALFTVSDIAPGATGDNCITISSSGSVDSTVKMYTTGSQSSTALTDALHITVRSAAEGTDCGAVPTTGTPDFDGSLTELHAKDSWATGVGAWDTGTSASARVVKISWELPTTADNTTQGATADATFTWQAVSK